ncbi:MAG: DeoR/GlpR transcriptional regulator [Melioribacteraceae bacterium]|nr:DeoR/GlpR transcriptional regulator [Melioribacteraceae bacterium]
MFETSAVTIRRDLQILEEHGEIKRVHGGAISHQSLFTGLALSEKEKIKTSEKERIAKYASELVKPGDVIIIDSGSTTLQFARNLKNKSDITVITNALNVASELSKSNNKIILTGGEMDLDSLTLIGPLADKTLKNISADKLFMGIDSIDFKTGLTTPNILEARTAHMMMQASGENILLADSSKFGRRSLGVVNKITKLDKIITDDGLDKEEIERLTAAGIEVIVV